MHFKDLDARGVRTNWYGLLQVNQRFEQPHSHDCRIWTPNSCYIKPVDTVKGSIIRIVGLVS